MDSGLVLVSYLIFFVTLQVLGDQPPLTTVDLHEDELAEILKANGAMKLAVLPALMILKLFLFSKK